MCAVKLIVEVVGDKTVSDLYSTEDLTLVGKVEREFNELVDTDGWLSIPTEKIGTISKIIAYVEDPLDVLATANLKIASSIAPSGIVIPINGIFVYSVDTVFADLITSVEMSTDSTTGMNCSVSIFGV